MKWLKIVIRELVGLFADNGRFAIAIIAWLCLAGFAFKYVFQGVLWSGPILFLGLTAILVESVMRRVRQ